MKWKRQYVQCRLGRLAKGLTLGRHSNRNLYHINKEYHPEHHQFIGMLTLFCLSIIYSSMYVRLVYLFCTCGIKSVRLTERKVFHLKNNITMENFPIFFCRLKIKKKLHFESPFETTAKQFL